MNLRASIAAHTRALQKHPASLGTPRTVEATQEIIRNVGALRTPAERGAAEKAALAEKFQAAVEKNSWGGVAESDWDEVSQVLWHGAKPLVTQSRFQIRYRHLIEGAKTSRILKRLIYAYLREFDSAKEGLDWAAKLLRKTILQQKYGDLEFWREQDFKYEFFSVELAPKRIAQATLQNPGNGAPLAFLDRIGLSDTLAVCGLGRAAYLKALERVSEKPTSIPEPVLNAFADWTLVEQPAGAVLLYPELRKEIYCSVLAEWHDAAPPPGIRRLMAAFFAGRNKPAESGHSWHEFEESELNKINRMMLDLE